MIHFVASWYPKGYKIEITWLQNLKDSISQLDKTFQFATACGKGVGRSAEGV